MIDDVCRAIEKATGDPARPGARRPVGGGSIHRTLLLDLQDGRRFFVKASDRPLSAVFDREAEGLEALRRAADGTGLRVPEVVGHGTSADGTAFLVLEAVDVVAPGGDFQVRFGRAFAQLHRATAEAAGKSAEPRYGFHHDNYLGATPQPNPWTANWLDFWRRHRLGDQLDRAGRAGLGDRQLFRLGERLIERLGQFLPAAPPAALLHGDLWGGNYLCDSGGQAVLIDPAAYCGDREADLAMTHLFGGFPPAFERAYQEVWPLEPGSAERALVYELHHLLNHLNLFGAGYLGSCLGHLRRLVG